MSGWGGGEGAAGAARDIDTTDVAGKSTRPGLDEHLAAAPAADTAAAAPLSAQDTQTQECHGIAVQKDTTTTAAAGAGAGLAVCQDAAADCDPTDYADLNRTAATNTGNRVSSAVASTAAPPLKGARQIAVTAAAGPSSKRDDRAVGGAGATAVPAAAAETAASGADERASPRRFAPAAARAGTTVATEAAGAAVGGSAARLTA